MHVAHRLELSERRCRRCSCCHSRHLRRRGAILIVVMVVLLITGLVASQTLQMLWNVASQDRQRVRIAQARELVELGRLMLEQGVVPASGEVTVDVAGVPGTVRFQPMSAADVVSYRIVAEYGEPGPNQAVASWEEGK